jgi:hypothetical protein
MVREKDHIVFLCYGHERVFLECSYALLSLSRVYGNAAPENTEIWIYTDKPEWFRSFNDCPLPLNYRIINAATVKQWRGNIDFVHRVKIEALKDLTKNRQGNILYVDTDSVFTNKPDSILENIEAGKLYMHLPEGKVNSGATPLLKKLDEHLLQSGNPKINSHPLREMEMWNAGVIGFNTKYNYLLDSILAFTDEEYPKFPKHIIEQFGCSVYFQQAAEINAAAPNIFHYWELKETATLLASFFAAYKNRNWAELVRLSDQIDIPVLLKEKENFVHDRNLLQRIINKHWVPRVPVWKSPKLR